MTITSQTTLATGTGDGAADEFSFSPIVVYDEDDLVVILRTDDGSVADVTLTRGTGAANYSVTLNSTQFLPSTGYITYPASGSDWLAVGETLLIRRVMDMTQEVDLENQGGYFPDTQEQALDKLTMLDLQQQEELDRAIKVQIGSVATDLTLPEPEAGKFLVWNADGDGLTNTDGNFTIDDTSLVVVASSTPSVVNGRIWIDTSGITTYTVRLCDGTDYNLVIGRYTLSDGSMAFDNAMQVNGGLIAAVSQAGEYLEAYSENSDVEGGRLRFNHNSSTGANGDIPGRIYFTANNSNNDEYDYAFIEAEIVDRTDGSEDAEINLRTSIAGVVTQELAVNNGLVVGAATGGAPGTGKVNATGYEINGIAVPVNEISAQSGTTHSPAVADHGKVFYYTNASGCTITLPAISSVFDGYTITLWNLVDDVHNETAPGGTPCVINRSGADTIFPDLTTFNLYARPGYNKQTVFVMNGQWHTKELKWEISFETYVTGGATFGVVLPASSLSEAVTVDAWGWCIDDDLGYGGDVSRVHIGTGIESSSAADTYGLQAYTAIGGDVAIMLGAGGIRMTNIGTGAQGIAATTKWVLQFFVGYI